MEKSEKINDNVEDVDFLLQKKTPLSFKIFVKDIDISRKDFIMIFFTMYSLIFSLLMQFGMELNISTSTGLDYDNWQFILYGLIIGVILSIYKIDKLSNPLDFIKKVLIFSFVSYFVKISLVQFKLYFVFSIFSLLNVLFLVFSIMISLKVYLLKTTILERGRVWAYLFIVNVFCILLLFLASVLPILIFIPIFIIFTTIVLLQRNKSDYIVLIPVLKKKTKGEKKKLGLKKYYLFFLCFGLTAGFATPLEISISLITSAFAGNLAIVFAIVFLFLIISVLLIGLIFDFLGRISTLAYILTILAISNYIGVFQTNIPDLSAAATASIYLGSLMAVPLLIGDIAQRDNIGKSTTISYLILLTSMIVGLTLRSILQTLLNDESFVANFMRGTTFMSCLVCFLVLLSLKETLPRKEQEWKDYLLHIYVIYESGVLLNEYAFKKQKEIIHADLISGGIVGLITLLREIVKGQKNVKTVDHGDRKLMFSTNGNGKVIFVLVVKEELIVFRRKLDALIENFDQKYTERIEQVEYAGVETKQFADLKGLINRYFGI